MGEMAEMMDVFQARAEFSEWTPPAALAAVERLLPSDVRILDAVCDLMRIRHNGHLFANTRLQHVAFGRQIAMYTFREIFGWSYPTIGKYFHRDHSTAIHAIKLVNKRIVERPELGRRIARMIRDLRMAA